MPGRNIVVIGASSGGIEALGTLMRGLPNHVPAALFVVQHIAPDSTNYLPQMLDRETTLPVRLASDGATIQQGTVYVAPADRHLLIDSDQMFLSRGPRENRARPAVDPLFRAAALSHGPRVIGVILSGSLDDGTAGLLAVKKSGGIAIVQDPQTAVTPSMPQSALDHVEVDHCVPAEEIGPLLGKLVGSDAAEVTGTQAGNGEQAAWRREVAIVRQESGKIDTAEDLGELVAASCPECGGPLWEMDEEFTRFRCHTGHAFTARHLATGLKDAEEQALWVALRVMEERVRMLRRLAEKDAERGLKLSQNAFAEKAEEAEQHVRSLRALLSGANNPQDGVKP